MNPEIVIDQHLALCEETLGLLLEENRILRKTQRTPEDAFLNKKRGLLPRLDESVATLRNLRENGPKPGPASRQKIFSAQKKLMKIFLLDRENEQLLLKANMGSGSYLNPARIQRTDKSEKSQITQG